MKRLIVCSDGTWNSPSQEDNGVPSPTNVAKLYNALAPSGPDGVRQLRYYHPGVGAEGSFVNSITGGAVGSGLSGHIRSAYHWLAVNYAPGDEIFIYGFSRGAFTARSLGGFLGRGLLDLGPLGPKEAWARVDQAYDAYRKNLKNRTAWARPDWAFLHPLPTPIRFLGVWDTVGALGVPDDLEVLNLFDDKEKWQFHDTALGQHVQTARHAMAINEFRASFTITRWSNTQVHPDARELWFPGAHSDVGGGYSNTDLADSALTWMLDESEAAGLVFRPGIRATIKPEPLGVLHNSYKGVFAKLRSRPRNVEALTAENHALFHPSAVTRQLASPIAYPAFRPTRILGIGETAAIEVYADTRWNETGIFFATGHTYTFSATGEWRDSKDACDWKGTQGNHDFTAGDVIRGTSSFLGTFESMVKKFTKNGSTDFLGTKRVENMPWFTLLGAIANDSGPLAVVPNDGSPSPHEYVNLPAHETVPFKVNHPGYFYCFPNDVWSLYDNNHGSVCLTITRVS